MSNTGIVNVDYIDSIPVINKDENHEVFKPEYIDLIKRRVCNVHQINIKYDKPFEPINLIYLYPYLHNDISARKRYNYIKNRK